MQATILVVDDQASVRQLVCAGLARAGYDVLEAASGREAAELFRERVPDLAILDLLLPDANGLDLLEAFRPVASTCAFVMITGNGDIATAVRAMKLGAFDFIEKPVNLEQLHLVVEKALDSQRMWQELNHWRRQMKEQASVNFVMGPNPRMQAVYRLVEQVARSKTTSVLIHGESGTGKEHVAQVIHCMSARRDGPFLELNCAALPEELLESELFGHERGAFTDAHAQKKGLLEMADGGTLFLDEVGEMSPRIQAKFLRVLETMTFRRVGGTRDVKVDVRIIAATNKDLESLTREGRFREDLLYRLKVVPIALPALRERPEDVLLLARHFMQQFNQQFSKAFREFAPEAGERMLRYAWPGNVRELRNVLERAVLLHEGETLEAAHLSLGPESHTEAARLAGQVEGALSAALPDDGIDLESLVHAIEKELVVKALGQAAGNQTQAARLLRINRDKMRYRVKIFGLDRSPALV